MHSFKACTSAKERRIFRSLAEVHVLKKEAAERLGNGH